MTLKSRCLNWFLDFLFSVARNSLSLFMRRTNGDKYFDCLAKSRPSSPQISVWSLPRWATVLCFYGGSSLELPYYRWLIVFRHQPSICSFLSSQGSIGGFRFRASLQFCHLKTHPDVFAYYSSFFHLFHFAVGGMFQNYNTLAHWFHLHRSPYCQVWIFLKCVSLNK